MVWINGIEYRWSSSSSDGITEITIYKPTVKGIPSIVIEKELQLENCVCDEVEVHELH